MWIPVGIDKKPYSKCIPFGHSTYVEVRSVLANVPSKVHAKGILIFNIFFDQV